ncbi:MAG: hypothetical protein JWN94_4495 [Betaproteobacteria bacterium]|nr:hypothetical protein [Betaproteobacteria bacterium]
MKTFLVAMMTLIMAGCAATTAKIDPARLTGLQKGKTTVDEVVRQFGRPSVISRNPDGTQAAIYYFSDPGAGDAMITLIATTPRNSTTFYFDSKGVLDDYKETEAPVAAPAAAPQPASNVAGKPGAEKAEAAPPAAAQSAPSVKTPAQAVPAASPAVAPIARKPAPIFDDRFPGSTTENR